MKKRAVISNLPIRLPFLSTVLYSFLLYYFKVDNLYWGIFITVYSIYWIIALSLKWNESNIDLFNEDMSKEPENKVPYKSRFQERIEEITKQREANKSKKI